MKKKQVIHCEVFNCMHCICDDKLCNLDEIKISNCSKEIHKDSTICDSYKNRN